MITKSIRITEIAPSPTNPRKTFDPVKLQELADSIASKGLIQPITVRPHTNGNGVKFELVAGERRFRATKLAKLDTIDCIVRELTDTEVLELQTIENLQRDDLHELEEAEGYAALMKVDGYDVDKIAGKIGKSTKYVYDRIKLLQLVPELREVFLAGEITAGHAILLARLSKDDQRKCLGGKTNDYGSNYQIGGLFQPDRSHGLELDDQPKRKAVSVRELETWIDDHVRFRPEAEDLPNLFPETGEALAAAAAEELKVVKITYEHQLRVDARDEGERTYSRPTWKRADGKIDHGDYSTRNKPSKECEHSVLGVVVAGRGRAQAFRVCIAKKKCEVHWPDEVKAARRAEKAAKSGKPAPTTPKVIHTRINAKQEQERKAREAEEARWDKAEPQLVKALVDALKKTPASKLVDIVVNQIKDDIWESKQWKELGRGTSVDDGIRYAAYLVLRRETEPSFSSPDEIQKAFKSFGVDAQKIVDQVAPKEKPKAEKPAPAKPTAKKPAKAKKASRSKGTARA